ncbi:sugar phosphate permease [Nocardiopsis sp. Huas11]|uniref:MFS transporter n=1 Tax=Nocardiopsis sp. Huas11 TaxID=2183912 RepID=UPI000EB59000|nr:MFS transporter [Nocardiopsis sp. Huas11]RKS06975.1 sugar phosphate permease [Nocardiopsis sp. Huas11]
MHERHRGGVVLAAVLLSTLVFPLSITGASTALPEMQAHLGGGLSAAQWVVNAYNACFAAFLVVAGSVADAVGRRRVYAVGVGLFLLSGVLVPFVQDVAGLVVLRAVGGVGAAAAVAGGTSLLAATFEGPARARAFGLLGTVLGAGTAFGPAVSGLLVQTLGWRAAFVAPALVAGAVLVLVPLLPSARGTGRRIDLLGATLFTLGLLTLLAALVEGPERGVPTAVGALAASALLLGAFVLVERGRREPLVDLALLTDRRFVAYALAAATFMAVLVPLLVYLPSYLIAVVGLSAAQTGLWLLMLTVPTLLLPTVGAELAARLPHTAVVVGALVLCGTGALGLLVLGPDVTPVSLALPFVLVGAGVGLTNGLIDGLAVGAVPAERAGTAAGVFNAVRLTLETIAIAVVGAVLAVLTGGRLEGAEFTAAFHTVALFLGGLTAVVVVGVCVLNRRGADQGSRVG